MAPLKNTSSKNEVTNDWISLAVHLVTPLPPRKQVSTTEPPVTSHVLKLSQM